MNARRRNRCKISDFEIDFVMDVWQTVIELNQNREKDGEVVDGTVGETTLLFVGNKKSGKTTVIYRFLNRDEQPKPTLALEYTFGRQNRSNVLSKDVCHIWELGGGTLFTHLLEFPLKPKALLNAAVIVVLDLSLPTELVTTLTDILETIRGWLDRILATDEARRCNLAEAMLEAAQKRFTSSNSSNGDVENIRLFMLPLIIIGGKYDVFQNFEPEQRKIICRTLRYFAHVNGAALQFFSSKMENLVNRTRVILSNVAFDTPLSNFVSQDYTKPLSIPAGVDSFQQIGSAFDESKSDDNAWKKAYEKYFPQTSKKLKMPEDPAKDPNFREAIIDNLRMQRDNDLERFMKDSIQLA